MEAEITSTAKALIDDVLQEGLNGVQQGSSSGAGAPLSCSLPTKKGCCLAGVSLCTLLNPHTWFNPERLHPTVESLIYWRDPKKSGAVFGSILVVLLSLAYFSLISVTAYLSLIVLVGTICFRIYKNIMQAVQKTSDGHPFKEFLELDLTLPQDKVKEVTELVVAHINGGVNELRRLFLVEDLIDSIKFGVLLWCLTYLGAWFNGMTLIIIGFIALFTLPKVYETNKTQIDANLDIVRTKLAEITSKVKAAVPIGKKSEEKKEQ